MNCTVIFGARQIARIAVTVMSCKLIQEASYKTLVKKSHSYRACRGSNRFQLLAPNSSRCNLSQDFDLFVDWQHVPVLFGQSKQDYA